MPADHELHPAQGLTSPADSIPPAEWWTLVHALVLANLDSGRAARFVPAGDARALEGYVDRVDRMARAELERVAQEGEAAWERLIARLTRQAYWKLRRLALAHAEAEADAPDLVQETCLILLSRPYPADVPYLAWAGRILSNCIRRHYFKGAGRLEREAAGLEESTPDPEADVEARVLRAQTLAWALAQLPSEAQREVLRRVREGCSPEEIAALTGRSVQAIYSLRHRAVEDIRERLQEE